MTPTEWGVILAAIAAVPRAVTAAEAFATNWLAKRRSDRPPGSSGSSGDKMRAVAVALQDAGTIKKIDSLHDALARQNPANGAYVVLEALVAIRNHAEQQTAILGNQTEILRQIAGPRGAPPDGRYRG